MGPYGPIWAQWVQWAQWDPMGPGPNGPNGIDFYVKKLIFRPSEGYSGRFRCEIRIQREKLCRMVQSE